MQVDFKTLADKYPEMSKALKFIEDLLKGSGTSFTTAQTEGWYAAFDELVTLGLMRRVYKTKTPDGVWADGEFETIGAIPERLPDRFNNYFETAEYDSEEVYIWN